MRERHSELYAVNSFDDYGHHSHQRNQWLSIELCDVAMTARVLELESCNNANWWVKVLSRYWSVQLMKVRSE